MLPAISTSPLIVARLGKLDDRSCKTALFFSNNPPMTLSRLGKLSCCSSSLEEISTVPLSISFNMLVRYCTLVLTILMLSTVYSSGILMLLTFSSTTLPAVTSFGRSMYDKEETLEKVMFP